MINRIKRIPVTVITGFLGSGKTTLLNRILKDETLRDTAVIVNEFGEVGIDHLLVEKADDGIIELSNGCLCCTMRGQLIDSLANIIDRLQTGRITSLRRVVIETTGLADPAPILQAIMVHPAMLQSFAIDGVITTVDAVNGLQTLVQYKEARRQVAFADKIVLTKMDLVSSDQEIQELKVELKSLNPTAVFLSSNDAKCQPAEFVDIGIFDIGHKSSDVKRWLASDIVTENHHHHHHDVNRHSETIRAFVLTHDKPIPYAALEAFIELFCAMHGNKILRMKGIVFLAEEPSYPVVIHGVQTLFHPPIKLEKWSDIVNETRLVMITDDLDESLVRDAFNAFLSKPAVDTADRLAMTENPLAISGFKF